VSRLIVISTAWRRWRRASPRRRSCGGAQRCFAKDGGVGRLERKPFQEPDASCDSPVRARSRCNHRHPQKDYDDLLSRLFDSTLGPLPLPPGSLGAVLRYFAGYLRVNFLFARTSRVSSNRMTSFGHTIIPHSACPGAAQIWPEKPYRLLLHIPFPPFDLFARARIIPPSCAPSAPMT